ncbi:unnamed protein product [Boreogadus saida]
MVPRWKRKKCELSRVVSSWYHAVEKRQYDLKKAEPVTGDKAPHTTRLKAEALKPSETMRAHLLNAALLQQVFVYRQQGCDIIRRNMGKDFPIR